MEEVYPSIFLIKEEGSFGVMKPPENVYVIAGKNGLIYDAGYGTIWTIKHAISQFNKIKRLYEEEKKAFNVTRILPSHVHPDHISGLKKLRKYLGLKIVLTEKMASIIKDKESYLKYYHSPITIEESYDINSPGEFLSIFFRNISYSILFNVIYGIKFISDPNKIIKANSTIMINGEEWDILPSPGHSSDHISLYNKEKGILLSGDNVLRTVTTWLGPPNSNIKKYIETIKMIQNLPNLKLILPAHGSPVSNPKERLKEIIAHRHKKTQQVLEIIQEHKEDGITLRELLGKMYSHKSTFMQGVAKGWVILTLRMLWSEKLIEYRIKEDILKFYPQ
ncbi:MAG: MBL fold metallo-hydrolase [Promethearchaeota archaeon]|nr:MAG: MBL fold metallo-hydrolase [Candidatus Lokiarchaeota archaeon]